MSKKYYAVKVGKTTGIYETWEECKASVEGYPGALYKSFKNISDAYIYMGWEGNQMSLFDFKNPNDETSIDLSLDALDTNVDLAIHEETKDDIPFSNSVKAVAYVDGSYNDTTKRFSYGCVMFYNGKEYHLSDNFDNEELAGMRNVAGEIFGSMAAMEFAVEHKISTLTIYHDYEGISKWCLGLWKTNKAGTIAYKKYYDKVKRKVNITFEKVKGHSGDKYNDLADELAKKELGI